MLTPPEIRAFMREGPLFQEFSDAELDQTLALLDVESYGAGDCVVRQDDPGEAMYLVVEGAVRVVHHRDGCDLELAVLRPGDFFGELALVDRGPRSADVEALEACTLLRAEQAAIAALAGVYPSAAFKFLITIGRSLVSRLRRSNQRYIDSLLAGKMGGA